MKKELTKFERELFDEIIAPALSPEKDDIHYGTATRSVILNFSTLLKNIENFYKRKGGMNWIEIVRKSEN